jgi:hypothetical protein
MHVVALKSVRPCIQFGEATTFYPPHTHCYVHGIMLIFTFVGQCGRTVCLHQYLHVDMTLCNVAHHGSNLKAIGVGQPIIHTFVWTPRHENSTIIQLTS